MFAGRKLLHWPSGSINKPKRHGIEARPCQIGRPVISVIPAACSRAPSQLRRPESSSCKDAPRRRAPIGAQQEQHKREQARGHPQPAHAQKRKPARGTTGRTDDRRTATRQQARRAGHQKASPHNQARDDHRHNDDDDDDNDNNDDPDRQNDNDDDRQAGGRAGSRQAGRQAGEQQATSKQASPAATAAAATAAAAQTSPMQGPAVLGP
jgi:hypothetical protein